MYSPEIFVSAIARMSRRGNRGLARKIQSVVASTVGKSNANKAIIKGLTTLGLSQNMAKGAMRVGGNLLFGDKKKTKVTRREMPSGYYSAEQNPTWSEVVGKVTSDFAGRSAPGIKIRGQQPFVKVDKNTTVNGKVLVTDVATATLDGADYVVTVHPSTLGGPLAVQAASYQMFVMRRMTLTYSTSAVTTQPGVFAICYVREPISSSGGGVVPTDFAGVRETIPSVSLNWYAPDGKLEMTYDGQQLFYTSWGAATSDLRTTVQGQFRAYQADFAAAPGTAGYFTLSYEMDLFFPTVDPAVVTGVYLLKGLGSSELELVREFVQNLRKKTGERKVRFLSHPHWVAESDESEEPVCVPSAPRDPLTEYASASSSSSSLIGALLRSKSPQQR